MPWAIPYDAQNPETEAPQGIMISPRGDGETRAKVGGRVSP